MKAAVVAFRGKEAGIAYALEVCGHQLVSDPAEADCVFVDYPTGWGGERLEFAQTSAAAGKPVFAYPHGGPPVVNYGGLTDPFPGLAAELVHAEAHRQILDLIGYPNPVRVIGWSYSPSVPFAPPRAVTRLLFAPAHPHGDGGMRDEWKAVNADAYRQFLDHPAPVKTVRMHGSWEQNGLWEDERVTRRVYADLHISWADIDRADAVIAEGTTAYLAVARGKPLVTFGQSLLGRPDVGDRQVNHWAEIGPLMRHPLDLDSGPLVDLLDAATVGGPDLDRWKHRLVGDPFDPHRFCELIESLIG